MTTRLLVRNARVYRRRRRVAAWVIIPPVCFGVGMLVTAVAGLL